MGDTVDWGEQRATQRQRTFKRGGVLVAGVEVARCTIRDMSLEGARVVMPDPGGLPDRFTLSIGDEGLTREVDVRSRSSTGMGVRFVRPLEPRDVGAEFLRHTSRETRGMSAEEARRQLVERARAGAERLIVGENAPALEMPDPQEFEGDEPERPDAEARALETETADASVAEVPEAAGTTSVEDELAAVAALASAIVVPTTDDRAADDAATNHPALSEPWDDGRGEGELGAVTARVPPFAVRRHLPWLAH